MGPIILKAWKHSLNTGNLPPSQLESVVTILPKEGKDNQRYQKLETNKTVEL